MSNYSTQQIKVLEGLDAVRRRPGMYIGDTGFDGLHHLVFEIVDNAVDECLAGYASKITVTLHRDGSVSVQDNGRGIPIDKHEETGLSGVELVFTHLHAGGKFEKGAYGVAAGLHGVGAAVVNALSKELQVKVTRNGQRYEQRFLKGEAEPASIQDAPKDESGTFVRFWPDSEIFSSTAFDPQHLLKRFREQAQLNPGLKIFFCDKVNDQQHELYFEDGIAAIVREMTSGQNVLFEVVCFEGTQNTTGISFAFSYADGLEGSVRSYANSVRTPLGGTHEQAIKTVLTRLVNREIERFGMLKKDDPVPTGDDVRDGLCAAVAVRVPDPIFGGQTKGKLMNSEVRSDVETWLADVLGDYFEQEPQIARAIAQHVLVAARAREAARRARKLAKQRSALTRDFSLPKKLADCTENDPAKAELFIVEGDSAGGTAKQGRDQRFQAILALRGKILNTVKADLSKVLKNKEVQSLIAALGSGIGKQFDLSNLRYHKVIIATDADVDGAHIRLLLLAFFFKYMRPLIEQGHLYLANPPLYRLRKGSQIFYAQDDKERDRLLAELGRCEIQRFKGLGEMNEDQLWTTTMDPSTRVLSRVTIGEAEMSARIVDELMGKDVEARKARLERAHIENEEVYHAG